MSFFPISPLPAGVGSLVSRNDGIELYANEHGALYSRWISPLGTLLREQWAVPPGRPHREGGLPALIRYGPSGRKLREEYFVDGRISRLDGPAVVDRSQTAPTSEWFVSSINVTPEDLGSLLLDLDPVELEREVACSAYARLLTDGASAKRIATALTAGLFDVISVRAHAEDAPVEWVRSFEEALEC